MGSNDLPRFLVTNQGFYLLIQKQTFAISTIK